MKTGLLQFWRAARDICFPPVCLICNKGLATRSSGGYFHSLCADCSSSINLLREPLCSSCGRQFPDAAGSSHLCGNCLQTTLHFARARSIVRYDGVMAQAIQSFKYGHNTAALPVFAALNNQLHPLQNQPIPDLIIPVPLARQRLQKRGFNQALLLARAFFPEMKHIISIDVLARRRETAPQTGLNGRARRKNIKGAFAAAGGKVTGKQILLVDDVFTTGTTVQECAKVLRRSGAREVQVLTLARADL
jgi:ComF family protein